MAKLAVDLFEDGRQLFKQGRPCPRDDGYAPTSWVIAGWERAAKEAGHIECHCVDFSCPYH